MKLTNLIFVLVLPFNLIFAQNAPIKLRHMEGFKSIKVGSTINPGVSEKTNTLIVGYNHYLKKNMFIGLDVSFESGKIEYSKVRISNLRTYFNYTVLDLNNILHINIVGGIFCGYEITQNEIIEDELNTFIYGALGGLSIEFFISNTICIEPFITQYWQGGSELGSQFYNKGISLKFNF